MFQLTQATRLLPCTADVTSGWQVFSQRLQQWCCERATSLSSGSSSSSAIPSRPAVDSLPSAAASGAQQGLLVLLAEQAAKLSGRSARLKLDHFGSVRFLLGILSATARGLEIGARPSAHAFAQLRAQQQSGKTSRTGLLLAGSLQASDMSVLSCLLDGQGQMLYAPSNATVAVANTTLRHVQHCWTSLFCLFAGDAAAAAASASSPSSSSADADESDAASSILFSALQHGAVVPSTPAASAASPTGVNRVRSLLERLRAAPQQAVSVLLKPDVLSHPDDEDALPKLSARELLHEDPFELLTRCLVSHGYARADRVANSAELHGALLLLYHLSIFQCAEHLAFGQQRDNQHEWAAEYRQQVAHACSAHAGASSQPAATQEDSPSLEALFRPLLTALRQTRVPFGAAVAASATPCCLPTEAVVASFLLPFLRQAYVLLCAAHALPSSTGQSTASSRSNSVSMTDIASSSSSPAAPSSPLVLEFRSLLTTLQLPDLATALSSSHGDEVPQLFQPLVSAFGALHPTGESLTLPLLSAFVPASFIRLPSAYDALFQALSVPTTVCTQCGKAPPQPALCLCCGRLLCAKSDCCNEHHRGELTRHTSRCCPCDGLYLLLREAGTLAVSLGLAHSAGSPYADRENETDIGLRRGRPLYLTHDRLEHLRTLFAQPGAITSYSQCIHSAHSDFIALTY